MTLYSAYNATLPSVKGKVFVITGTTSGTGYVAARTAAEHGGEVLLLNRNSRRAEDSLERLQKEVPGGTFVPVECDLQDFASVRKAAAEIKNKYGKLYCLGNNAGIMAAPDRATKDGYDVQMQTNHLSHFLLTSELYPLLEVEARENGDARIVNHSSGARLMTPNRRLEAKYLEKNGGNLGGDELGLIKGPCFVRYFHSKLANAVFTYGLHEQLKAAGSSVRAIAAHPGISNTNLSDNLDFGWWKTLLFKAATPFIAQSSEDGALGFIKGMMDLEAESGVLYGPKLKSMKGPAVPNPPKTFEIDPEAIKMLWELSNKAVGTEFRISKL